MNHFRLLFCVTVVSLWLTSCQPYDLPAERAWITYTNHEYGYAFDYPGVVRLEISPGNAQQVIVHVEPNQPFELNVTPQYSFADLQTYLGNSAHGQKAIGPHNWSEFVVPAINCQELPCSNQQHYVLRMESQGLLFTVTFKGGQLTALQTEILASLTITATGSQSGRALSRF